MKRQPCFEKNQAHSSKKKVLIHSMASQASSGEYTIYNLEDDIKSIKTNESQKLLDDLKIYLEKNSLDIVKNLAAKLKEELDTKGREGMSDRAREYLEQLKSQGFQQSGSTDPKSKTTTIYVQADGSQLQGTNETRARVHQPRHTEEDPAVTVAQMFKSGRQNIAEGSPGKVPISIEPLKSDGSPKQVRHQASNQMSKSTKSYRAPDPQQQNRMTATLPPQSVSSAQQMLENKEADSVQEILEDIKKYLSTTSSSEQPEGIRALPKNSLGYEVAQLVIRLKEDNTRLAKEKDNEIETMEQQLKTAKSDYENLQKEREKAENKIKEMEKFKQEMEKSFNDHFHRQEEVIHKKEVVIEEKEADIKEKERDIKEYKEVINQSQTDMAKLKDNLLKVRHDCEGWKNQCQEMAEDSAKQQRKLNEDITQLHRENKQLKSRVSELAGAKLMDNNPDIADLSDPNRALKLGEKFSGLYDDDWTDAYQTYTDTFKMSEQQAIEQLLKILMKTYEFCRKVADEQMDCLYNVFENPCQDIPKALTMKPQKDKTSMTQKHRKDLKDLRKQIALKKADNITKQYLNKEYEEVKKGDKKQKSMLDETKVYYEKCVEVCWPMVLHDPPVKMDPAIHPGVKIDPNRFRLYGGNGDTLEYIVWPPLLVEGGGLLAKGVAKPKKEPRVVKKP